MKHRLDHLVLCVHDLNAARALYERLGFTTTPPAEHPFGTGNSLIQLDGNFLELLAVVAPDKIPPPKTGDFGFAARARSFLESREGMALLALDSTDARRDLAAFQAVGLTTYAPIDFSRGTTLPDGSAATVSFSLAVTTVANMPEAAFFVCQQHEPENFWRPEYQRHENGATRVGEVIMAAPAPQAVAGFLERMSGGEVTSEPGQVTITLGQDRISVLGPARFAKRFPGTPFDAETPVFVGFRLLVADLAASEARWRQGGITIKGEPDRPWIGPEDTHGVIIELGTESS